MWRVARLSSSGEHEGNDVPEEFAEDESVELVAWEKSWAFSI